MSARGTALAVAWILGLSLVIGTLSSLAAAGDGAGPARVDESEIYRVCPGGPPACDTATIQAAVDQAAPGDEIRIAAGTYTELTFRAGVTQVVYLSKTLSLRGGFTTADWDDPDPAANPTRLDAGGASRVIYVSGGINIRLEGLELTDGDATGMGGYQPPGGGEAVDAGGGVYVVSATVILEGNDLYSNTAAYGGGLFVLNGRPTISNSTIMSNSAVEGGGLAFQGCTDSLLVRSLVAGNEATSTAVDTGGGGLHLSGGDATLSGVVISGNAAGYAGGGAYLAGARVTIIHGELVGNTAGQYGAGLQAKGSTLVCDHSRVASNTSGGYGGGMSLRWSDVIIQDSLIEDNEAEGGAGIESYLSDMVVTRNMFTQNRATMECGGAGHLAAGTSWVSDNLVTGNSAGFNGGGIAFCTDNAIIERNTVISNTAGEGGGGFYFSHSQGTMEANILRDNAALFGGGLGLREGSTVIATNTLVADNMATTEGGGIYVESSGLEALHTTLAHNGGLSGLAVSRQAGEASWAELTNSILVSHTLGVTVSDGSYATLEATLWGAAAWANDQDWAGQGTLVTGTHNLWQEPGFLNGDYYLGVGSAAVDGGIDAGVGRDVEGQPRPHLEGYDLGADELWPVVAVKRATPAIVERGQLVTYSIWLTNATGLTASVRLTDPLPAEVRFVGPLEFSHGAGGYAGGVITWAGTLQPAEGGWLNWNVSIAPETPYSTTISNHAVISDPYGIYVTEGAHIYLPPRRAFLPLALK